MSMDPTGIAPAPEGYTWWHHDEAARWELGRGLPDTVFWQTVTYVRDAWLDATPPVVAAVWLGRLVDSVDGRGLLLTCPGCGLTVGYWPHLHPDADPPPPPCPACGTIFDTRPGGQAVVVAAPVPEPVPPSPPRTRPARVPGQPHRHG